jgi:hypothetical protein
MRQGLNTFRKCGRPMEMKVRANGDTDVTEVLRKRIDMSEESFGQGALAG